MRVFWTTLIVLCGLAAPVIAQPEDPGVLLLSVAELREEEARYDVVLYDLATAKRKTLLRGREDASQCVVAVSPKGKTMVVAERGSDFRICRYTFRPVSSPKKVLGELGGAHLRPVFLDESSVLSIGSANDRQVVIKRINVRTQEQVDLSVIKGVMLSSFNGSEVSLSPNRRRIAYWNLAGRSGPVQHFVLELASGQTTLIHKGSGSFSWAEDSLHGYLVEGGQVSRVEVPRGRALQRKGIVGSAMFAPEPLGQGLLLTRPVPVSKANKTPPRLRGVLLDPASGTETLLSNRLLFDSNSRGAMAKVRSSQSFVFVEEKERGLFRLVLAQVKAGKVQRKTLFEGKGNIGSLLSAPRACSPRNRPRD